MQSQSDEFPVIKTIVSVTLVLFLVTAAGLYGCPQYSVYSSEMAGKAELAQADFSKRVAVQQAHAKMDSAHYEAQAEIIRAQGVAKANKIIGDSLKNNEAYLRYLFVNNLADTKDQIIYIPTEANLPILEATRKPVISGQ